MINYSSELYQPYVYLSLDLWGLLFLPV